MAEVIPFPVDDEPADTTVRTELEGVVFLLRRYWNKRAACWVLDILDELGQPLAVGLAVRSGSDMTGHLTIEGWPGGRIVAVDSTGSGIDPGIDELGQRVDLVYVTAQEVAEAQP